MRERIDLKCEDQIYMLEMGPEVNDQEWAHNILCSLQALKLVIILSLVGVQNVIYKIPMSLVSLSLLGCSSLPLTFTKDIGAIFVS